MNKVTIKDFEQDLMKQTIALSYQTPTFVDDAVLQASIDLYKKYFHLPLEEINRLIADFDDTNNVRNRILFTVATMRVYL